ncbi:MAG: BACON domain-containing protein [Candidatus Cryptobacteroides sp.]
MKKSLFAIALAGAMVLACKPEPAPVQSSITLKSDAEVQVPVEGGTFTVEFEANVAWTAELDVKSDVAALNIKSGTPEDQKVKVSIQKNDVENVDRTITLTLLADGVEPVKVVFKQASVYVPYFTLSSTDVAVGAEGGSVEIEVTTNCEYGIEPYEAQDWLTLGGDANKIVLTAVANGTYNLRYAAYLVTVPAIQVPVVDEETGEETGDTAPYSVNIWFWQSGQASLEWASRIDTVTYNGSSNLSMAIADGKIYVCNTKDVYCHSLTDGSLSAGLGLGEFGIKSITNDDAGNVIVATGGGWYNAEAGGDPDYLNIGVLPASDPLNFDKMNMVIMYTNGFYGLGLDNVRATGDCYSGDGVITLATVAGEGDAFCVAWQIKGGKAVDLNGDPSLDENYETKYTDYVTITYNSSAIWNANNIVTMALSDKLSDGVLEIGYDGIYALRYNPSMSVSAWTDVLATGSSWAEGYNALDVIEWNGHRYCAFIGMAYFPNWGMPSYLWLVNIDDINNPVVEFCGEYTAELGEEEEVAGPFCCTFTDLKLVADGDNLKAYIIDGSWGVMGCYNFPKL